MSGYRSRRCECLATGLEDRCTGLIVSVYLQVYRYDVSVWLQVYRSDRCECLATGLIDVSVWLQV